MTMTRAVRRKLGDPVSPETIERLKRLAEMPDDQIRTDLIPERRFDVALARERRKAGWTPGKTGLKKAS
jgi:hypothetical protein